MEPEQNLHVIVLLDAEGRETGLYYIEDRDGEKALPVFTTAGRVEDYLRAIFERRTEPHPSAIVDIMRESQAPALTEGRFVVTTLGADALEEARAAVGAEYVIWDPPPGDG